MKTVSAYVEEYLHEYPFLSKFLRQGVINYKALARQMEPIISKKVGQRVSVGAIAVSLQRIKLRDQDKIYSLIGRLRGVTVVTGVSAYTSTDHSKTLQVLQELLTKDASITAPFVLTIRAHSEVLYLVEQTVANALFSSAADLGLSLQKDKQAALVVTRELLNNTEVGGLCYPLQVLAEHGILVNAASASFNEEVLILDESNADKAATILRHVLWR